MDKLPIFKTAWVAHKQVFVALFNRKNMINFFLPIFLFSLFYTVIDTYPNLKAWAEHGYDLTAMDTVPSLELDPLTGAEDALDAEGVLVPAEGEFAQNMVNESPLWFKLILAAFMAVYLMVTSFMAVKWHRKMMKDEDLTLNFFALQDISFSYLLRSLLIFIVTFAATFGFMYITFAAVSAAFVVANGMSLGSLLIIILSLVLFMWLLMFWILPMYLMLPALSVKANVTFKEIRYMLTKGQKVRFFVLSIVTQILFVVPTVVLFFLLPYVLVNYFSTVAVMAILLVVGSVLSMIWPLFMVSALSMFFMHYILPQMGKLEVKEDTGGDVAED